jgi:hypothetical protein
VAFDLTVACPCGDTVEIDNETEICASCGRQFVVSVTIDVQVEQGPRQCEHSRIDFATAKCLDCGLVGKRVKPLTAGEVLDQLLDGGP